MKPPDRLRKQGRAAEHCELVAHRIVRQPERRNRIRDDDFFQQRLGQHLVRITGEHAVRGNRQHPRRAMFAAGARGTRQCRASADQVIDNHRILALHLAHKQVAADDVFAAMLLGESRPRLHVEHLRQQQPEAFGTLDAAGIRRRPAT